MFKRSIATLLLVSIAWHSLLGAMPAVASVCLGGGHVHAVDDDATTAGDCEVACGHELGIPQPASGLSPADHCGCTDIEFESIDLLSANRHDLDWSDSLDLAPVYVWASDPTNRTITRRGPPQPGIDQSGCTQQRRIVRTTRLLL